MVNEKLKNDLLGFLTGWDVKRRLDPLLEAEMFDTLMAVATEMFHHFHAHRHDLERKYARCLLELGIGDDDVAKLPPL